MKPLPTILLVISTCVYIVIGGVLMHFLESDYEASTLSSTSRLLDQATQQFLNDNRCVNVTQLFELLKTVVKADQQRVFFSENVTDSYWHTNWDISRSIYFIAITLTTIGYGHVTPKSDGGRAFTVIYALIGIPLQMATLAAVGVWLSRGLDRCFLRPCRFDDNEDRCTWSLGKHVARTIISFAVFLVFFAIIPAFIFRELEDWTIGEGVYYALISLTTIGYGDYEAGYKTANDYRVDTVATNLYKISLGIWILLGLASCASVINTMHDTYTAIVWRVGHKAIELKEKAGFTGEKRDSTVSKATSSRSASRSKRRVEPADSDRQSEPESDGCNFHDDRIWIT